MYGLYELVNKHTKQIEAAQLMSKPKADERNRILILTRDTRRWVPQSELDECLSMCVSPTV